MVVGYSVYLGVDGEGRKQQRFFRHRSDAEKFLAERNQTSLPIGELRERVGHKIGSQRLAAV